ncbi:MFS transporter [Pseudonocardia acaciae]|uniref:MFS transporter n=1 Tax=Pseudonocardia acaciae TaxID=551276 RepID=UPI0007E8E3CC|nr:MFS transporter [Pseudonocardia acaciae]
MRLSYVRQLTEYPVGARRIRILTMAVLAVLIGNYEAQIAPVVPLLLDDLHMSLATYGSVSAVAAIAGALATAAGGRLADHYGRIRLLVPLMLVTGLLCLAMTLVHTPTQLLVARIALAFVDGMALAHTAPLVRDFSPRMGRAQAFGFWTWGPVGSNFLAGAVAGLTLPLFADSWRSQFVIMGVVSLAVSVVIAFNIAELSPELRDRIRETERQALGAGPNRDRPPRVRDLLASRTIWAHVIGISLWLMLYLTLMLYGQTMISHSFGMSAAAASRIMSAFWVLNLLTLVVIGRVSDRLRLRKPICVAGTLAALVIAGYLTGLVGRDGVTAAHLMVTGALLGGALGVAYGPWMANYSEDAEDVDPRLQGTAWGIYGFMTRAMAVVTLFVVPHAVEAVGWAGWLMIAMGCLAMFVPASLMFGGPWRRASASTAASVARTT